MRSVPCSPSGVGWGKVGPPSARAHRPRWCCCTASGTGTAHRRRRRRATMALERGEAEGGHKNTPRVNPPPRRHRPPAPLVSLASNRSQSRTWSRGIVGALHVSECAGNLRMMDVSHIFSIPPVAIAAPDAPASALALPGAPRQRPSAPRLPRTRPTSRPARAARAFSVNTRCHSRLSENSGQPNRRRVEANCRSRRRSPASSGRELV